MNCTRRRIAATGLVQDRQVWGVTEHTDVLTCGSPVRPRQLVHVYTVVMDGETGMVTSAWLGCDFIHADT